LKGERICWKWNRSYRIVRQFFQIS